MRIQAQLITSRDADKWRHLHWYLAIAVPDKNKCFGGQSFSEDVGHHYNQCRLSSRAKWIVPSFSGSSPYLEVARRFQWKLGRKTPRWGVDTSISTVNPANSRLPILNFFPLGKKLSRSRPGQSTTTTNGASTPTNRSRICWVKQPKSRTCRSKSALRLMEFKYLNWTRRVWMNWPC